MSIMDALGLGELTRMSKRQVIFHHRLFDYSFIYSLHVQKILYQFLNFGMIISSAMMIWKGLMVATGSESPIVVVLSGSMEPAFHRGDLLFLTNHKEDPIRVGDIVVFKIKGRDIPIVHRVLTLHEK
ncbi:signal peptidase complex catalytic subunit SEC11C-like protein [Euroglyphus maynei]|uniref:Signal peptidase complex catalytic subunit SEC11 n=1 Tax=Euroglyphus maynei TaxID=6958 RepID=A0A1Y3B965_EURMA|nr:signal peptidase complex catalytic subunit SEC11C-like protein [Euroglyphus maynei]